MFALAPLAACVPATDAVPAAHSVTAEESAAIDRARSYIREQRPDVPIPEIARVFRADGLWYACFEPSRPPGTHVLGGGWITVTMTEDELALVDIVYGQ